MPLIKTETQLRERAIKYLEHKSAEVSCFNEGLEAAVPQFEPKELQIGEFLGAGGFCIVSEVSDINLKTTSTNDEEKARGTTSAAGADCGKVVQDRNFIATNVFRNDSARYAIKKLSPTLYRKPAGTFLSGVIDLAMEVKYLAVVQHPHIIKMRAISSSHPCSDSFFIVLDKLYETLTERLSAWQKSSKKLRGFGMAIRRLGNSRKVKSDKDNLLAERLLVAHDICSALSFLHSNKIVYRDIKPDNIGFDVRGDVKIFDFGLAKELSERHRVEGTNVYKMTKKCGSPRYMAPEVFKGQPYNHNVDVYAFGLMLWQICEGKTIFEDFSYERLSEEVMMKNQRPAISETNTPRIVNKIITSSWSPDISIRPECKDICSSLKEQIVISCGEQIVDALDITNRTDASINAKAM